MYDDIDLFDQILRDVEAGLDDLVESLNSGISDIANIFFTVDEEDDDEIDAANEEATNDTENLLTSVLVEYDRDDRLPSLTKTQTKQLKEEFRAYVYDQLELEDDPSLVRWLKRHRAKYQ